MVVRTPPLQPTMLNDERNMHKLNINDHETLPTCEENENSLKNILI